jgi:hypothetical protein
MAQAPLRLPRLWPTRFGASADTVDVVVCRLDVGSAEIRALARLPTAGEPARARRLRSPATPSAQRPSCSNPTGGTGGILLDQPIRAGSRLVKNLKRFHADLPQDQKGHLKPWDCWSGEACTGPAVCLSCAWTDRQSRFKRGQSVIKRRITILTEGFVMLIAMLGICALWAGLVFLWLHIIWRAVSPD